MKSESNTTPAGEDLLGREAKSQHCYSCLYQFTPWKTLYPVNTVNLKWWPHPAQVTLSNNNKFIPLPLCHPNLLSNQTAFFSLTGISLVHSLECSHIVECPSTSCFNMKYITLWYKPPPKHLFKGDLWPNPNVHFVKLHTEPSQTSVIHSLDVIAVNTSDTSICDGVRPCGNKMCYSTRL